MPLTLTYFPVHRLWVGGDHLVHGGVTSACSLMSPGWSGALGLEVPEGLVRVVRLPADGQKPGESCSHVRLPLVLLLPGVTL